MFKLFIFILLLFIKFISDGYTKDCTVYINATQKGERAVLLMGGKAIDLFEAYIQKLKERKISCDYRSITVKLWNGKQIKEYKLRYRSYLEHESPISLWERELKNVEAEYNNDLLVKAKQYGWDIYCVGASQSQIVEFKSHINLGLQFIKSKDYDNAIKEFKEAVKIDPTSPLAYANLANAYLLKENYNLALETYLEGIEHAGDDGFLHLTGAIIYTHKKEYSLALRAFEKALASGFKDIEVLENNADLKLLKKARKRDFCEIINKYQFKLSDCLY